MLDSKDPIASAIIENYRLWSKNKAEAERRSSVLFDTVAVYLACEQEFCQMERLSLRVTDEGLTVIDNQGQRCNVATAWKGLDAYPAKRNTRITAGLQRRAVGWIG